MAAVSDALVLHGLRQRQSRMARAATIAKKKYLGTASLILLVVFVLVAALAPVIAPYPYQLTDTSSRLQSPSFEHLLGTDVLGRDVLSRIMYGARVSLFVGLTATALGMLVGGTLGISSAYFGGRYDLIMQRFIDTLQAFPNLIIALTMVAVLGSSLFNVTMAITIGALAGKTRISRSAAFSVISNPYLDAARVVGCSNLRIMARYVLPNAMAPIIVITTISLGTAILAESSLSFLGLGPPPPNPTWGSMLSGNARSYMNIAPWLALAPGIAITLVVLSFNLLGDAVRDVLDPRLRGT
ncbi:MAG: ABC transporter permease [Dehalococcoidia bacterium]